MKCKGLQQNYFAFTICHMVLRQYTNLFFCLFIKIALVPELNLLRICDLSLTIPTLFQDCHYPLCLMSQATFIYFFLSTDQDHFVLLFGVFLIKNLISISNFVLNYFYKFGKFFLAIYALNQQISNVPR